MTNKILINKDRLKKYIIERYGSINKFVEDVNKDTIARSYLYALLKGEKTNPSVETIYKLAKLLETDPNDLIVYFHDLNQIGEHNEK